MNCTIVAGFFLEFEIMPGQSHYFDKQFLKFYDEDEACPNRFYLKQHLLLHYIESFMAEFHHVIGMQPQKSINKRIFYHLLHEEAALPKFTAFPTVVKHHFRAVSGTPLKTLLFYEGSHHQEFFDFYTLHHFEKLIQHGIKNPLAKIVKLGIYNG